MTSLNISNNSVGEIVTVDGWSYSEATTGQMAYFKDGKGQLAAPPGCGPLGVIALADAIKTNGALATITFGDEFGDIFGDRIDGTATLSTSMTQADFSSKNLGPSGAVHIVVAFLPKCQ